MWRALGEDVSANDLKQSDKDMKENTSQNTSCSDNNDAPLLLGIEEDFRIKVVEWILDVCRFIALSVRSLK